ncbi:hypothetical protein SAY87_019280 [Trapa incisa]|uniref:Myb-like domain-containing protein n=2 Tax=Trapa TaxID=22665 RepID=A0AAN7LVG1_TRANT|nr:hypothetical protein SAY87_019280 [Trapa incisa]KAK4793317.1 hypothetical protein SAY86_023752 [Trapa natans]
MNESVSGEVSGQDVSMMKVCVMCGKRKGDQLLVCAETGCPISLHVRCFPHEPKFDPSRKFFCPYCSYKRAIGKVEEMKKRAILARGALSNFFDSGLAKDGQNQASASAPGDENEGNEVVPPNEMVGPAEDVPCQGEHEAKESSPLRQPSKKRKKVAFENGRRATVTWTIREEEMLLEGVQRFSDKSLPWRRILEFGSGVFDSSRIPMDLKDKWRNMQKRM